MELGLNHAKRQNLRARLRAVRMTCPLFDTAQWVRDLEKVSMHASFPCGPASCICKCICRGHCCACCKMWHDGRWRVYNCSTKNDIAVAEGIAVPAARYGMIDAGPCITAQSNLILALSACFGHRSPAGRRISGQELHRLPHSCCSNGACTAPALRECWHHTLAKTTCVLCRSTSACGTCTAPAQGRAALRWPDAASSDVSRRDRLAGELGWSLAIMATAHGQAQAGDSTCHMQQLPQLGYGAETCQPQCM